MVPLWGSGDGVNGEPDEGSKARSEKVQPHHIRNDKIFTCRDNPHGINCYRQRDEKQRCNEIIDCCRLTRRKDHAVEQTFQV
jgi:hypothetical protein